MLINTQTYLTRGTFSYYATEGQKVTQIKVLETVRDEKKARECGSQKTNERDAKEKFGRVGGDELPSAASLIHLCDMGHSV